MRTGISTRPPILWARAFAAAVLFSTACAEPPPPEPPASKTHPIEAAAVPRRVLELAEAPARPCETPGFLEGAEPLAELRYQTAIDASDESEHGTAMELFERAARDFENLGDHCRHVDALIWQGLLSRRAGDFEQARELYDRAFERARELHYLEGAARSLNNLGVLEHTRSELRAALEHYSGSRLLWRRLDEPWESALLENNTGITHFYLGYHEAAAERLAEAIRGFEALGEEGREPLADALTWAGRVHAARDELEEALELLTRALEIRRALGQDRERAGTLDALGWVYLERGDLDRAEAAFRGAVERLTDTPRWAANTQINLAELYRRRGEAERAAELARATLSQAETAGVEDPSLFMHGRFVEARAEYAAGRSERARELMEKVIAQLEAMRLEAGDDFFNPYFTNRRMYFEFYVDLLLEAGEVVAAFDTAESARARGLLDALTWQPGEALERERRLRRELTRAGRALERARERGTEAANARFRALRLELARLESETASRSERLNRARPRKLGELRPLLGEETLLLVYWTGEKRSLLWAIDAEHVEVSDDLPPRETLERAAERFHALAAKGRRSWPLAERELEALGEALLGPIAERLDGRRLVIVPDGALSLVPFAALSVPGASGAGDRLLIEEHALVSAHSLSVIAAVRARAEERRAEQEITLALVADAVYNEGDERGPTRGRRAAHELWARLASSREEARAIASRVPEDQRRMLLGFEATRERVLRGALGGARVVHLAAHAEFHPEHPELSRVVLSLFDRGGQPIDANLRLQDLHQLDLAADLVVLSACETAPGPRILGEGPLAFPREFLRSGAASVVATLWQVDDRATAALMDRFYHHLLESALAPAEALRRAQLDLARGGRFDHPIYWAPFVVIGDWAT